MQWIQLYTLPQNRLYGSRSSHTPLASFNFLILTSQKFKLFFIEIFIRLGLIVTMLDEVAWLFNLRGTDIPFNPLFFSYCYVGLDSIKLFMNPKENFKNF